MADTIKNLNVTFHNPNTSEELIGILINLVAESMYKKISQDERANDTENIKRCLA